MRHHWRIIRISICPKRPDASFVCKLTSEKADAFIFFFASEYWWNECLAPVKSHFPRASLSCTSSVPMSRNRIEDLVRPISVPSFIIVLFMFDELPREPF